MEDGEMRVLVACEFSGIVRDAFRERGHYALSIDLLPTEIPGQHIIGDVTPYLKQRWDLVIAHPVCTRIANSGVRWLAERDLWEELAEACEFFCACLKANADRICVENPIPHKYALEMIGRRYDQIIQPWMFGHGETKATCLWLNNLSNLVPTDIVDGRQPRVHHASPGPDRWKERSRTLPGIAAAMADQWGSL